MASMVLRVREANDGWARYIQGVVDHKYGGNQSALANALGVAASTVTRWIDGATPTIGALHDIRAALGTPMIELLIAAGVLDADKEPTGISDTNRTVIVSVAEAIKHDADLIDEARQHLLNQYELLLRLPPPSSPSVAPGKKTIRRVQAPPDSSGLRAVARGGDPAHREEVSRMARRVREQHTNGEGTEDST